MTAIKIFHLYKATLASGDSDRLCHFDRRLSRQLPIEMTELSSEVQIFVRYKSPKT